MEIKFSDPENLWNDTHTHVVFNYEFTLHPTRTLLCTCHDFQGRVIPILKPNLAILVTYETTPMFHFIENLNPTRRCHILQIGKSLKGHLYCI